MSFFIKEKAKMPNHSHYFPVLPPFLSVGSDKSAKKKEKKCVKRTEIEKDGAVEVDIQNGRIHCLTIIGQIEGHYILGEREKATKYEHLIPLLVSIEESDEVDGLLIILNTMGGDVEAGLAISEMIASMKKPTVSLVLGGGHSIGVPLAVASNCSFIVPSATMTVHPVRINGTVIGSPQTYNYLRDMQNRIERFIISHSKITKNKLSSLMMKADEMATDIGSILEGDEAVAVGLIDKIGGLSEALSELRKLIDAQKNAKN